MKEKISDFMDNYVGFIDYGVRAWMFASISYILIALLGMIHLLDRAIGAYLTVGVFWIMSLVWTYDFAKGYVPVWWLRLGHGKKAKARLRNRGKYE